MRGASGNNIRRWATCAPSVMLAVLATFGCGRLGYDGIGSNDDPLGPDGGRVGASGDASAAAEADGGQSLAQCIDPTCDLVPQCGCESGEACSVNLSGDRLCAPAGQVLHGDSCSSFGSGECSAGTECLHQGDWPSTTSLCMQFCNTTNDCAALGLGSLCALSASIDGQQVFKSCTVSCDLLDQTGCPSGTQCSVYNFGTVGGTNCTSVGARAEGESCSVHFDCGPAMMCVGGTCRNLCIDGDSGPCKGNTSCTPSGIVVTGIEGSVEYGACL